METVLYLKFVSCESLGFRSWKICWMFLQLCKFYLLVNVYVSSFNFLKNLKKTVDKSVEICWWFPYSIYFLLKKSILEKNHLRFNPERAFFNLQQASIIFHEWCFFLCLGMCLGLSSTPVVFIRSLFLFI